MERSSRKRAREEENNEMDDVVERNHVEQNVEDAGNKEVENVEEIEDGKAVQTDSQTDMTSQDIAELENESQYTEQVRKEMENEIGRLRKEVDELVFKEDTFKNNNEKVLFYTGLTSWDVLDVLFQYVKPKLKKHSALSAFQQLISTFMRLRLGLSGQDLAYRF